VVYGGHSQRFGDNTGQMALYGEHWLATVQEVLIPRAAKYIDQRKTVEKKI
jgi:hypothetical protein